MSGPLSGGEVLELLAFHFKKFFFFFFDRNIYPSTYKKMNL